MALPPGNIITLVSFAKPIVHLDANAFFTSVEQALKPELRGKPVVTGKERGIVACASYEAKALGVQRPMRLFEAKKICPQLICLPSDYETYSLYSKRIFAIMRRFTPAVEEYSIDEAFAELSGLRRVFRMGYSEIARKMKADVQRELGITVSVGLSGSKLLAKLASGSQKPDGFTVVRGPDLHAFLSRMDVEKVCGIGPNSAALLRKHQILSGWDFISQPGTKISGLLGKPGFEIWKELRAEPVYEVNPQEKEDYASICKSKTFTPPSCDKSFVRAQLLRNVESAFIKLRRHRLQAKRMVIALRTQDFRSAGLEGDFDRFCSSTFEGVRLANWLFDRLFREQESYRHTACIMTKIQSERLEQRELFDDIPNIEKVKSLDRVIDGVNELYGKHSLHLGATLWLGRHRGQQDVASLTVNKRADLPQRKKDLLPGETARQRLSIPLWQVSV